MQRNKILNLQKHFAAVIEIKTGRIEIYAAVQHMSDIVSKVHELLRSFEGDAKQSEAAELIANMVSYNVGKDIILGIVQHFHHFQERT